MDFHEIANCCTQARRPTRDAFSAPGCRFIQLTTSWVGTLLDVDTDLADGQTDGQTDG